MKNEFENPLKIRQALEQASLNFDSSIAARLEQTRHRALDRQKTSVAEMNLAGVFAAIGGRVGGTFLPHTRTFVAFAALTLGVVGTYYWNAFEQADENEEVDSALLADELPVDAYTDQGFEAWLEHAPHSSSAQ